MEGISSDFHPKNAVNSMEFELVSYKIHSPGMDPNNPCMKKTQVLNQPNNPWEKLRFYSTHPNMGPKYGFVSPPKNEGNKCGFSHGWWVTVPNPLVVTAGIEDIFDPRGGGDHIAGVERILGWKNTP